MNYLNELLDEINVLQHLVESAIRDRAPGREDKHFYRLECAIQELNREYPERRIDIEDIKKQLEDLRSCPKQERTD